MNVNLDAKYELYINGQWVAPSGGKYFTTTNPATGEKLAECAEATKEDVDAAVQAAWAAFPAWRDLEPDKRAAILLKIADIIDENKELLATIESMDNGKPIRETMTIDVPYSSDHFRYFAGAIRTEEGSASILKDHVGEFMNIILHEPIGVVGQIVPWNFPFLMAAWKLAPALAAAVAAPDEIELLRLTAGLDKDKEALDGVLGALRWIFRDALAARCGAASRLSTSPETADKLARALTRAQLMALLETVEGLEQARLRNMNATLFVTLFCARLRAAAGR